jgi:hypothetical protein
LPPSLYRTGLPDSGQFSSTISQACIIFPCGAGYYLNKGKGCLMPRQLLPDEIIQEGDEYNFSNTLDEKWRRCHGLIGSSVKSNIHTCSYFIARRPSEEGVDEYQQLINQLFE